LLTVRIQLAQTQKTLALEKSPSEDAVWDVLGQGSMKGNNEGDDLERLAGWSLVTQEANPVYTELVLRASEIETELGARPGAGHPRIGEITEALETLQRKRETGLTQLREAERTRLSLLERERQRELSALLRERDDRLGEIDRSVELAYSVYRKLANQETEASLARALAGLDEVQFGLPAVPPPLPEGKGVIMKTVAAALLGLLLGIVVAAFRTVLARGADPDR
jgi:uncharacterized protein involved in exopolysaccharide biosynthesis